MLGAPDKPHAKYPHVYAIMTFDSHFSGVHCATVVKVFASTDLAEQEAARLRGVNKGKQCSYAVQTTRFVGTPIVNLIAES